MFVFLNFHYLLIGKMLLTNNLIFQHYSQQIMGNQVVKYDKQSIIAKQELFRVEGETLRQQLMHRSIGALTFLDAEGQIGFGSAVLISENLVLTAAHNVYNRRLKAENEDFKFYFEWEGVAEQYHEFQGWKYPEQFKNCWEEEKLEFEYALMKLERRIKVQRFPPLKIACPQCVWHKKLSVFGFPSSLENYSSNDEKGEIMKPCQYGLSRYGRVVVNNPSSFHLAYKISALPGMDGCPVFMDEFYIIAIHVGGGPQSNIGRLIDASVLNHGDQWIRQFDDQDDYYCDRYNVSNEIVCPHILNLTLHQHPHLQLADFTSVVILRLHSQRLASIDLSQYANLTKLQLSMNQLRSISFTSNILLKHLSVCSNQLQQVDLSKNINLTHLHLRKNNLSKINLNSNTCLSYLQLHDNRIQEIDLSSNISLQSMDLGKNKLRKIDLRANIKLNMVHLPNNQLQAIDISENRKIILLQLSSNKLSKIEVSHISQLQIFAVSNNDIIEIDLSKNKQISKVKLSNNKLHRVFLTIDRFDKPLQFIGRNHISHQRSEACRVEIICPIVEKNTYRYQRNKNMREIALEAATLWKDINADKDRNMHKCEYTFQVI